MPSHPTHLQNARRAPEAADAQPIAGQDRVSELEQEVENLKERLAEIERQFEEFRRILE